MLSLKSVPLMVAGVTVLGAPIVNPAGDVDGAQLT